MRKTLLVPAIAVTALAVLPGIARATSTTCATTVVCAEYINSSSGVAIHGEANTGIGIRGTSVANTGFYGASGSGAFAKPGVEGESTNASGNDAAGVFGLADFLSAKPAAIGIAAYGASYGAFGETAAAGTSASTAGFGVYGNDPTANGAFNAGVVGVTTVGTGVLAEANGTPSFDLGYRAVALYAVANAVKGSTATGIEAESDSLPFEARNTSNTTFVQIESGDFIFGSNPNSGASFYIAEDGNEVLSGTLYTSKGTYARTTGKSGRKRVAFGTRSASPEIEDVGEASLTNGSAVVTIDAAFGDSVDMRRPYHVFITPEGDCNQLYVTQKTQNGFVVRESHGGRSSLAFDYRIVAKPADENGERLAVDRVPLTPASASAASSVRTHVPAPLSPEQRLMQRVGMRAYEKAVAELRSRLKER